MAAAGTSALITSAAASVASLTALTSAGPASRFAPGATVMMFSPPLSTVIMASPVGTPRTVRTAASLTPSATRAARSALPKSSSPTQPAISTSPAEPGRGDRLVGALAARREGSRAAEHRRAGRGQPRHGYGDVHVQAAQHGQPRARDHRRKVLLPRRDGRRARRRWRNPKIFPDFQACSGFLTRQRRPSRYLDGHCRTACPGGVTWFPGHSCSAPAREIPRAAFPLAVSVPRSARSSL